jgi:hypothetical protein
MRFEKEFKPYKREITKRRIGCAKRAIQKQKNRIPLFADQVNWPTPIQRITAFDEATFKAFTNFRKLALKNWLEGRRMLRDMDTNKKKRFLEYWNNSSMPGKAEYFLDAIHNFEN